MQHDVVEWTQIDESCVGRCRAYRRSDHFSHYFYVVARILRASFTTDRLSVVWAAGSLMQPLTCPACPTTV